MSDPFFSGIWQGEYICGPSYPEGVRDVPVNFQFDLTVTDGVIKGTFTEDIAIKQPGTIEGFIEEDFISFIKKYPYAWSYDEHRNLIEYPDQPSHETHYTGNYSDDSFSGEWEIIISQEVQYDGSILTFFLSGTWSMKLCK
jgi:hypothetical protein